MEKVRVEASGSYDVLIGPGLMEQAGELTAQVISPCRAAVITDDIVQGLYGEKVKKSLEKAGFSVEMWAFSNGERQKTMETLTCALCWLSEIGLSRSDVIIALGGGVPGDLAGFAAAVYCRGTRFIQIPTTLLAAVDSSVGGKTAVDLPAGKNMAGAFHQPELVICDTDVMRNLPEALLRDGTAEMLKYGMLEDADLFDLMASGEWKRQMDRVIARCVAIKRDYVVQDEKDHGLRQFLNLGHTFGHAVEKCSAFTITHGQGVGIGLCMAARAAGIDAAYVEEGVRACGLETLSPYTAKELAAAALSDKKRKGGKITLVLPIEKGKCRLQTLPVEELPHYFAKGTGEIK
ncbi:MAG: 3-dehydroquinate synthase [Clostridiales bacterium]|nr:3-dehydroquinate synthase [Clostridiales bacterium]